MNFDVLFEKDNQELHRIKGKLTADDQTPAFSPTDIKAVPTRINAHKAADPEGILGRVLRACAGELVGILAGVLRDLSNLSLVQIVPVLKQTSPMCLNDYRPVALTPIVTKCFEQLVQAHLKSCHLPTLDPHQFASHKNRSPEDPVTLLCFWEKCNLSSSERQYSTNLVSCQCLNYLTIDLCYPVIC